MPTFRITGDTLTAFGIEIELPKNPDLENTNIRERIARELGLTDYLGAEDFRIDDFVELDENGKEVHPPGFTPGPQPPIEEEYAGRRQGRMLTRLYAVDTRKIRVSVYSDSYDFQSYARAELFDGERWNIVATTEPSLTKSAGKCHGNEYDPKHDTELAQDADEVFRKALLVLG